MSDDNSPNPWAVGAGLGLCLACGAGLAAFGAGLRPNGIGEAVAWLFAWVELFTFGLGTPIVIGSAVKATAGVAWGLHEFWHRNDPPPVEPDEPDEEPEPVVSTVDLIDRLERRRLQEVAHWHVFYRRLYAAGTAYGWDIRTLTGKISVYRVMTQPAWNVGTDQLAAAGVIVKDQAGTRAIVSEADWTAERMWERVPCPAGEPPDILPPPYSRQYTAQNTAQNNAIEGQVAR